LNANIIPGSTARANWLLRIVGALTAPTSMAHVPVEEPSTASKPDVAVGADERKRVGDMRQVIPRVGAWKLGLRALENLKT
jgi:hypothetical protein